MKLLASLRAFASVLFHRSRIDTEMDEELRAHIQNRAEDLIRSGLARAEAERRARLEFGGYQKFKEECREAAGVHFFETLLQDLRFALRMLRKSPGFTAVAVLTLALGIGANTAIFSAAHAVLWSTLPVANPKSLVLLVAVKKDGSESSDLPISLADELRRTSPVLSGVITRDDDGLSFSLDGGPAERVMGEVVSPNYFTFLGVRPILGQGFSEDIRSGKWAAEVVLSYRFWQRRFQGDPRVLGRIVNLNDFPFTIVGVSPPSFYSLQVGFDPDLILPHLPLGLQLTQVHLLSDADVAVMARLKPGVGILQAQAAVNAEWQRLAQENGSLRQRANPMREIHLQPGDKGWQGLPQFREPLWILLGLAGLVLLIASTNLASMLLARATTRSRELALRAALGARRGRLIRQMATESALLSLAGGLTGFAAMSAVDSFLLGFLPQSNIRIILDLKPDFMVVGFAVCLTLLTLVLLGLLPALQATRSDVTAALKTGSAASVDSISGAKTRNALVAGQVALSLLLLIVAGLLWQTLGKLRASDFFLQPDRVMLFTIKPQVELYNSGQMRNLTTEVAARMAQLPGVKSASLAENGPLGSRSDGATVANSRGDTARVAMDLVTPGYFATIGVPLLAGRDFSFGDRDTAHPEVIINQALSGQLFKNENPLSGVITPSSNSLGIYDMQGPLKIVGVVKNVRYYDLHQPAPPAMYLNMEQGTPYMPTLHLRLAPGANPADVVTEVRREFNAIDTNFPVFDIKTLASRANDSLARERLVGELASAFGFLALLLVALGLYGVMAYSVARRSREIGIRMALGAEKNDVLRLVIGQGLKLAMIGVLAGLIVALGLSQFLSSLLYGVRPADPLTFIVVSALLTAVALLASYIPARKATKVDPMVALRYE